MRKIATLTALAAVSACAPAPETIQAVFVSDLPYRGYCCDHLGEEAIPLNQPGQIEAIRTASLRNNCPEVTRIHSSVPPGTPPVQPGIQPQPPQPVSASERT